MKIMQVSILLKNLQLQYKMLHKLEHQTPNLLELEFQMELSVKDEIHLIRNIFGYTSKS